MTARQTIGIRELRREQDAAVFLVTVSGEGPDTSHEVRVCDADRIRLVGDAVPAEELLGRSFRFLLAREPKGSILPSFDIMTIARYFPEYPERVKDL